MTGSPSKTFRIIKLLKDRHTVEEGLTINQLCLDIYADKIDKDGIPTCKAKASMRSLLRQIRKTNPDMLLYARLFRILDGYEWRYQNIMEEDDKDTVIKRLKKLIAGCEQTEIIIENVFKKGKKRRKKVIQELEETYNEISGDE